MQQESKDFSLPTSTSLVGRRTRLPRYGAGWCVDFERRSRPVMTTMLQMSDCDTYRLVTVCFASNAVTHLFAMSVGDGNTPRLACPYGDSCACRTRTQASRVHRIICD